MTKKIKAQPFADPALVKYLTRAIERSDLSQKEMAQALGYENPNIISMFKTGQTKIPLDKVADLARVLKIDPAFLFRLVAVAQVPKMAETVDQIFGGAVSRNERAIIEFIREVSDGTDPGLNDRFREVLANYFSDLKAENMLEA